MNSTLEHDDGDLLRITSIATLKPADIPTSSIGYGACRSVDDYEKLRMCGEGSYGIDLAYMLNRMDVPFTESQVKCLLLQLFEGLDYLHRRYRAPELLLGSEFQDTGVDQWSAGCIMAELLLHRPFLPGESEIDQFGWDTLYLATFQITKIIAMFGTPTEKLWPGMSKLRFPEGFSLMPQPYNNLKLHFPHQSDEGLDLMHKLFCYDPKRRATADACINHRYFDVSPLPCSPELMPSFRTLLKPKKGAD
ncbi:Cyclin-dependent kinase 10 isoform X3 [Aphelenchoides fujianensis]|nr:Cyclin-dependent kinase 10 isoform X3 [Aphelenchoides fujianensis]